jgi:hypothetical protein
VPQGVPASNAPSPARVGASEGFVIRQLMLLRKTELELELGHHHTGCRGAGAGGLRRTLAALASLCTCLRHNLAASLCKVHPALALMPKNKEHKTHWFTMQGIWAENPVGIGHPVVVGLGDRQCAKGSKKVCKDSGKVYVK